MAQQPSSAQPAGGGDWPSAGQISGTSAAQLRGDIGSPVQPMPSPLPGSQGGVNALIAELHGALAASHDTNHGASNRPVVMPHADGQVDPLAEEDEEDLSPEFCVQVPSWLVSAVVHLMILLALALATIAVGRNDLGTELIASYNSDVNSDLDVGDPIDMEGPVDPAADLGEGTETEATNLTANVAVTELVPAQSVDAEFKAIQTSLTDHGDLIGDISTDAGNAFGNRLSGAGRARMARLGGATPQSEEAVALALKWLSEHQLSDGSWCYDHTKAPACHARCGNPGEMPDAKHAATAMALLPFLGTGQTHKKGQYKKTVEAGLNYLTRSMRVEGETGSLYEPTGTMYAHGLAAIALSEAYGMTQDSALQRPAQLAINFIVEAQDTAGGGWRYQPKQAGDTSVVGWQLMALKSAHMSYLKVPAPTVSKAGYFLDSVQSDEGSRYGYTGQSGSSATTAIGLLCRMYLGWKMDHPGIKQGVVYLDKLGPSVSTRGRENVDLYYDYYATQVMHHYGGAEWKRWNDSMRDFLVRTQNKQGHERGSWYYDTKAFGGRQGGRLFTTAMATMTLEVYYRFMPLYKEQSTKDDFFRAVGDEKKKE